MGTSRRLSLWNRKSSANRKLRRPANLIEGLECRVLLAADAVIVSFNPSATTINQGQAVTLSAVVAPFSGNDNNVPAGSVTFQLSTGKSYGPFTLDNNGDASTTVANLPVGADKITANFTPGDTNFLAGSSPQETITVNSGIVTNGLTDTSITSLTGPSSAPAGSPATFVATVTPTTLGGPGITGTITFSSGGVAFGSPVTVVDGSGTTATASITTSSLALGSDTITAVYNGDTNYNPSNNVLSIPITITAAKTSTMTALMTSGTPKTFGTSVTFTATVTPGGAGTPTGTVVFMDGINAISGSVSIDSSGVATFATSSLHVGGHTITAVYSGDSTFAGSTSSGVTETINAPPPISTTLSISSSAPTAVAGTMVTFTVDVTPVSNGPQSPTGTVTFSSDGTVLGSAATVDSSTGMATFTTSSLSLGSHKITAVYSGDSQYITSSITTGQALTETITPQLVTTTTRLHASSNTIQAGRTETLTATISPGSATGMVQFSDGGNPLGSPITVTGGIAVLATSALGVGSHMITATYSGDSTDASSVSSTVTITVNAAFAGISLTSSAPPSGFGTPITYTAAVSPAGGGPAPTGLVTFLDSGTPLGAAVPLVGGVATFTVSTLAMGPHTITAAYSGDAIYSAGTSAPLNQTVGLPDSVTTLTTSNPTITVGTDFTLTAVVTALVPGGPTPTGTVNFFDGTTQLNMTPVPIDMTGTATLVLTGLTAGSVNNTAQYSGDTNYAPSTSAISVETIQLPASQVFLSSSMPIAPLGIPVTLTAVVSPFAATGTVTFFDGSTQLAPPVPVAMGNAVLTNFVFPIGGVHDLTAQYSGDSATIGSTSAVFTQTITPGAATTTVVGTPSAVALGASVTLTVTVAAPIGPGIPIGLPTPTGTVTLIEDGITPIGPALTLVNGSAFLSISTLALGTDSITAVYSGDNNYLTNTSPPFEESIQPITSTTSTAVLSSSATSATFGTPVTFTANIAAALTGGAVPTGNVTFFDGSTAMSPAVALDSTGAASFTTSSLPVGTDVITATYNGDSNYITSTTQAIPEAIVPSSDYVTNLVVSNSQVNYGTTVSFTATVLPPGTGGAVPTGGLVTFSDGGTPLAMATVQANGQAVFSSALPAGTYDITASFAGAGGAVSNSEAVALAVHAPTSSALGSISMPATAIAGQKISDKLPVIITGQSSDKVSGEFTVEVYADLGTTLDSNAVFIGSVKHKLTLKDLQSKTINGHIKALPNTLPSGAYHLLLKTIDPSGNVGVSATPQAIQVTGAFIRLAGSLGFVTPSTISVGGSGSVFLSLTNNGNEDATGPLVYTLNPSSDGKTPLAITLFSGSHQTTIPAGQTRTYKIHFSTTSVSAGSYVPYVTASLAGVTVNVFGTTPFTIG